MILFDRQAELIIENKYYKSDEIDIEFNVPFSEKSEPSVSEISIYNLSPDSISSIKKGAVVALNAGYKNDIGVIAAGVISSFSTTVDHVDKKTTIKIASAADSWEKKKIQKTYSPGITTKEILEDLIPQFGVSIGEITPAQNITYQKGRSVSGRLKDILMKFSKETGSKFYINNQKVYIRKQDKGDFSGFILSGETGLLGSPEQMEIDKKTGWKVKCLLNHRITVDTILQIESKTVKGMFRTVKGNHNSEWITEMEVVAI